ncbi:MAG: MBL fold metallo-hydrolase [Pirellulales bacterium]
MLLKYFYDNALAHASYLVGCQKTKEAIIVDPGRDIDQYLATAGSEGVKIVAAAETHIHADFVSGARELAERVGAKLFLSDEGSTDWKYLYANEYDSQLLKDGDIVQIGQISFEVLHTPGHTPESISFVLTDKGGGATRPMGIFTGDFVFVGAVGRPDLLEEAAGVTGSAEPGARDLFASALRFKQLPDYLQVWPAHGAGSACGKGLGAIPSSTVGYEKLFNPALQFTDEQKFVDYILSEQPEAPKYFAIMKRVNKEGPKVLGEEGLPPTLDVNTLADVTNRYRVIDTSPVTLFAKGHVADTINIPAGMVAQWAGWFIDYDQPIYLITSPGQLAEVTRVLRKIGVDHIAGVYDSEAVTGANLRTQSYVSASPEELVSEITSGDLALVDVRAATEWMAGHIAQAQHLFLGRLPERAGEFAGCKVVTQCLAGGRSAIAASILQAAGAQVTNMDGGITAWKDARLPITKENVPSGA